MLPESAVKARVVDITHLKCSLPSQLVVDANVLYWLFYPSFNQLDSVSANSPKPYQLREYPKFYKRLLTAGIQLYTTAFTLAEVATTAEAAELQLLWWTDENRSQHDSFRLKAARHDYASSMASIRQQVDEVVKAATKQVSLLPKPKSADAEVTDARSLWKRSFGDFGDAMLVSAARRVPVCNILSDDADLLSFKGVTLYTANRTALNAGTADKGG